VPATPRFRSPGRPLLGLLTVAVLATAGCSGLDQASAAGVDEQDLVAEVAAQMAGEAKLAYTASYRLTDGEIGRVARTTTPERVAYTYPGGRLIRTPEAVTRCAPTGAEVACTATDPGPDPATNALPAGTGLVTPDDVRTMLDAAAIDPDVTVTQRDTTLAGRHASCLRVSGAQQSEAPEFEACVTVEGALARFAGTIDGKPAEVVLTDYAATPRERDFTLPPGATLTDHRKN
jgi:hypothetical protein